MRGRKSQSFQARAASSEARVSTAEPGSPWGGTGRSHGAVAGYLVSTKGPDDRDRQHKLAIDEVDLASELRRRALTLQSAPTQLTGTLRFALRTGLPVFEAPAAEPRQAACRLAGSNACGRGHDSA